jgi:hypothetical protein
MVALLLLHGTETLGHDFKVREVATPTAQERYASQIFICRGKTDARATGASR